MMANKILGLNEALLVVNKINLPTSSLKVLYQTSECYGCPLIELAPTPAGNASALGTDQQQVADPGQRFVLGTKFNLQLELRQLVESNDKGNSSDWCRLPSVALNNQGQYQVDVSPRGGAELTDGQTLLCSLKTVDSGECLLCPFAILACLLFAIFALEQLYIKFWLPGRERHRRDYARASGRKLSSHGRDSGETCNENQTVNADDGDSTASSTQDQQQQQSEAVAAAAASPLQLIGARRRVECLDTFRGLTLTGMIFVNYGGAGYAMWDHTPWDGITPADFVFPFFIFSMGASVAISVPSLLKRQQSKSLGNHALKILRRSALLGLIGLCLNSKWITYDQPDGLTRLRITGVLQRFSISYLVVACMYTIELTLNKWIRAQSLSQVPYLSKLVSVIFELLTGLNYLALHVYLTYFFEYDSSCPVGYTGPGGQTEGGRHAACTGGAAAWLDRQVLGTNHIYNDHEVKQIFMTQVTHDPEGILGYTTSILLTLIGLQCGKILIGSQTPKQKVLALVQWSLALMVTSSLVVIIPINKRLWSLTFVTVTGLAAFLTITLLYLVIDVYSCKKTLLLRLVSSAGKNSIFLYVGHSLISGMLPWWFPIGNQASHLQLLLRLSWATFVWLLVAHYMALKGLFIKI